MDIYPQDLGPKISARIVQLRVALADVDLLSFHKLVPILKGTEPVDTFQVTLLKGASNRRALRNALLSSYGSGGGAFALASFLSGGVHWGLIFGAIAGLCGGGGAYLVSSFRRDTAFQGKVTLQEVQILTSQKVQDTVTQEFLQVVTTLLPLTPPDAQTAKSILSALRNLGTAIGRLPAQPAEGVFTNVASLNADVSRLTEEAKSEKDAVIAASLARQVEALARRAETTARAATLMRRNQVLRDEVAAQVKAFRTSLAAVQINGGQIGGDFEALAESVAQVAHEANALADARAELEAALAPAAPAAGPGAPAAPARLKTT